MKEITIGQDSYPLSGSQLNIWALEQSFSGTSINNICQTIRIRGTVDIDIIQKCLNLILESDSTLRTQFTLAEEGSPVQYETGYTRCQFPVFDFSATNEIGIRNWENSITREVMPLQNSPLYYFAVIKVGEHEGGVIIKTHHLISDGWSQIALINRFAQTYLALLYGEEIDIEASPSYRTHVEAEAQYLTSKAYERDQRFWRQVLQEAPVPTSIKECSSAVISPVGQRRTFYLSESLGHEISAFCTSQRMAPFSVFFMAMVIYLKRIHGSDNICIGAPVHNRNNVTDRKTTGMFVSTLPLVCQMDESASFQEFSQCFADDWLDFLRHQRLPFSEIAAIAKAENPGLERLFHLVFSFHNSSVSRNRDTSVGFSGKWHYAGYQAEHICIHLNNMLNEHCYSVDYDYLTQLFSEDEIEKFHGYIINILNQVLKYPDKPIRELMIIGPEEEEKVLFTFNKTEKFFYDGSLCQKLSDVCRMHPSRVAVIQDEQRFTYQALWQRAGVLAAAIMRYCPDGRQTIAVLLPKSYELYAVLCGIARAGCAWVILAAELPVKRSEEILADSQSTVVISTAKMICSSGLIAGKVPVIDINKMEENELSEDTNPASPEDLAYMVYTSGSTGKPKGVEIEQRSLLNFAEGMQPLYGKGAVLSLCSISFDAFLVESMAALLNGQTVVLPLEGDQENPQQLAALINQYAVDFLAVTPSRLLAYLKNIDFLRAASRLESIICGGEVFPGNLLKMLSRVTGARIYNQYGPSETTVGVSTSLLNDASFIGAGAPMQNCRFYILDQYLKPLPIGVFGDLYIGGICVGRGYHNAPELTSEVFLDNPFEPSERIYRTGDIAAWHDNGEIILKGREDGQVKLRGQRIELEEIASQLAIHPVVRQAVVRLCGSKGQEYLAAYYAAERDILPAKLLEFLATYLPGYMIPSVFIKIDSIPLTGNGKVDYSRLPDPPAGGGETDPEQVSETQAAVLAIFRETLEAPQIKVTDDYFLSGGDSLKAMGTLSALEEVFGIRLRVADLYACRTALLLGELLCGGEVAAASNEVIPKAPVLDSYPLTPAQMGIYFETQMAPERLTYNMPCAFSCSSVDREKLRWAAAELTASEPALRMTFFQTGGEIRQRVEEGIYGQLEVLETETLEAAKEQFLRPFDLSRAPLLRVGLWQQPGSRAVIMMDMHHIVGDAMTAALMLKRLNDIYCGTGQLLDGVSFLDYVCWKSEHQNETAADTKQFWQQAVNEIPELPEIPTDFPRQKHFDYQGKELICAVSASQSRLCDEFCEQQGITSFMFFVGAFGIFLAKLTGSQDFMIGTPISERRHRSLADTAGLLINTLPIRLKPGKSRNSDDYFTAVREMIVGALDHPEISLDELIELSGTARGAGGNPLYNTLISMRPVSLDEVAFGGSTVEQEPLPAGSAKFDLNIEVSKDQGCYHFRLEYASSLFTEATAALYSRSLLMVIQEILLKPGQQLSEYSAVSAADQFALVEPQQSIRVPFADIAIDRRIDAAAQMNPDAPAVIFHDQTTTFGQLKEYSDRLSDKLVERGIGPGNAVGILCTRGVELVVGMLGVLKSGAAYVPMQPSFPEKRLQYMTQISSTALILADPGTFESTTADFSCDLMKIDLLDQTLVSGVTVPGRSSEDNCFILFTSGSTGEPKGVTVRQRSLANLFAVLEPYLAPVDGAFLCTTNFIFDIFTTESMLALALGKPIVMADEEEMMLPWKAAGLIKKHRVGMFQFTPSRAKLFLDNAEFFEASSQITLAAAAGEVMDEQLVKQMRDAGCKRILNLYGPTEATVYATLADVTEAERITIGRILPNCRGYILDKSMRPVMPMARGELYIAGECLSGGYAGRDDLTETAYVDDLFYPGQKMYKSGDIVRLLSDGKLDYLGRQDHQIKLNGQRIELGEITKKIQESGLCARAAVIAVKESGITTLQAFIEPNDGKTCDVLGIRRYLEALLPSYMIPSRLQVLEKLPCTASGKIDVKKLQTGEYQTVVQAGEKAEPAADVQPPNQEVKLSEIIENLWQSGLNTDMIDPCVSFFEQGGNSFAALTLLGEYYNHGLTMTLAEFYDNPTLKGQLEFYGADQEEESGSGDEKVLLTGATGFLGAHLLKTLLESGYQKVFCLNRSERPKRLEEILTWYFGEAWLAANQDRISSVKGDIMQEDLGITPAQQQEIAAGTTHLVHAAADVRHYANDGTAEQTNREGTRHAAAFAGKIGARLIHISTISITAEYIWDAPEATPRFTEQDFEIGQNWQDNVYLRGKYAAEQRVREAMEEGLSAAILRVGRLVGRSADGVFQQNSASNAFFGLVDGILCLDMISAELAQLPIEMTAVDECAKAAVLLMKAEGPVYHLYNPHIKTVGEILDQLNRSLPVVDKVTFETHLRNKLKGDLVMRLSPLLSQYNRLMKVPFRITPECQVTLTELEQHQFTWKEPNAGILLKSFLTD